MIIPFYSFFVIKHEPFEVKRSMKQAKMAG